MTDKMTYDEAREYLTSMLVFGIRIGLERIVELLKELNHPERGIPVYHIAGTNGKGSISSYLAHILAMDGKRVGWFTSPFLVRFTERIRILDGVAGVAAYHADDAAGEISEADFARHMTTIREAVNRMRLRGVEPPTEFELITAAAFLHFQAQQCDVLVLETGLGGRLDSTNVIAQPVATIIGSIGHDHHERLGDTIGKIAMEKSGIIKAGVPLYAYTPEDALLPADEAATVRDVLTARARELRAPLTFIGRDAIVDQQVGLDGQTFTFEGVRYESSLLADYQAIHAALAVSAAAPHVSPQACLDGVRLTRWPGRLEKLRESPYVLLDGAHNPEGIKALAGSLVRLADAKPLVILVGMLRDKDTAHMVEYFFHKPIGRVVSIVCTMPDSDRAMTSAQLADQVAGVLPAGYNQEIKAIDDPWVAARYALYRAAKEDARLICFGSLYLAGAVRETLRTAAPESVFKD